jgi:hypothetical protein
VSPSNFDTRSSFCTPLRHHFAIGVLFQRPATVFRNPFSDSSRDARDPSNTFHERSSHLILVSKASALRPSSRSSCPQAIQSPNRPTPRRSPKATTSIAYFTTTSDGCGDGTIHSLDGIPSPKILGFRMLHLFGSKSTVPGTGSGGLR